MYDWLAIELEKNSIPTNYSDKFKFNFGIKELINIVDIPKDHVDENVSKFLKNSKISEEDGKITTTDVAKIRSESLYFRKMDKIKKKREYRP